MMRNKKSLQPKCYHLQFGAKPTENSKFDEVYKMNCKNVYVYSSPELVSQYFFKFRNHKIRFLL